MVVGHLLHGVTGEALRLVRVLWCRHGRVSVRRRTGVLHERGGLRRLRDAPDRRDDRQTGRTLLLSLHPHTVTVMVKQQA